MLTRTGLKLEYQQTARTAARHPVSLLCVFRNEHLLLQYFISYYRALGIERFIMIDNLSDDGGPEIPAVRARYQHQSVQIRAELS